MTFQDANEASSVSWGVIQLIQLLYKVNEHWHGLKSCMLYSLVLMTYSIVQF